MRVHIEILRDHDGVRTTLKRAGWKVDDEGCAISARHPQVADETSARDRLGQLGLLTSNLVRIEFEPVVVTRSGTHFTE